MSITFAAGKFGSPRGVQRRSNVLEHSLFESRSRHSGCKPLTVVVSAIVHVVTISVLVLIPLIQIQAITIPPIDPSLLAPRIETPKPVKVFSAQRHAQKSTRTDSNILTEPEAIPERIGFVDEATSPTIVGLLPPAVTNGLSPLLLDTLNARGEITPPGPPPLPAPAVQPPPPPVITKAEPIRRGGNVQAANLTYQVNPVYPPLARQIRVQGVVVMEAVINKEGSIESLRVISGHPLLNQAALDAVKQWRYRPTMLNGEPVEVITTVTVTFSLR